MIHSYGVAFISVVIAAMYVLNSIHWTLLTDFHSLNGGILRDIPYFKQNPHPLRQFLWFRLYITFQIKTTNGLSSLQ